MTVGRWKTARRRPHRIVERASCASLLVVALLAAGCRREPESAEAPKPAAAVATATPPPVVKALLPLGRADLVAAERAAADAVAAGTALPQANLALTDRTFELRLPFGCADAEIGAWGKWTLDPKTRVLRVTVRAQRWGDDPVVRGLAAGMTFDAAEGFWLERPWTSAERCPAMAPETEPAPDPTPAGKPSAPPTPSPAPSPAVQPIAPAPETFALVRYFSPDAPRTLRRGGRPYTYTAKVSEEQAAAPMGLRLKLVGRIAGFADGQPIHCAVVSPVRRPVCAAAVEFTDVVLEDADGETLTEWVN